MNDAQQQRRSFIKQVGMVSASIMASTIPSTGIAKQTDCKFQPKPIPFYGKHQSGIATPAQSNIYFLVVDLHSTDLVAIKEMFQTWTKYSINLMQGKPVKPNANNAYVPPTDTGETASLDSANLTITFGVSASFFDKLNIVHLKPKDLVDLPHFPRDQLREPYVGGDICIQACADDPQVAFHAIRNLVRVARGEITMKWSQTGFNSYHNTDTPRNLFGFKDGTGNPQGAELDEAVWSQENSWFKNGTYLVARRIQMYLETWDRTAYSEQENTFGRYRTSGAPMGKKHEFDKVDLNAKNEKGASKIPEDSHVHLAHKTGKLLLRRSFSYASGIIENTGAFDAGLMFISFQRTPQAFITIQNSFGNDDKMNEYITHIGSGLFACFPGVVNEKDYLGKSLFDQI